MIVLASASPRRQALLQPYLPQLQIRPADIDERQLADEAAQDYVARLAAGKNACVRAGLPAQAWVIAADTCVVAAGNILGKPDDFAQACAMWQALQHGWHQVWTGVCVAHAGEVLQTQVMTEVLWLPMDAEAMRRYWASGEPQDKAGAYAIQGLGGLFVAEIRGSYSNVVGLPLAETAQLLKRLGLPLWSAAT